MAKKMTTSKEESLIEIAIDCISFQQSDKCPSSCHKCPYNVRNYTETDNDAMYIMVKAKQRIDVAISQEEYRQQKQNEEYQSQKIGCLVVLICIVLEILFFKGLLFSGWGTRIIAIIVVFFVMMGALMGVNNR